MLGYIDWIIILIALMAAAGAFLLFYLPSDGSRDVRSIRDLRQEAEADRKRIADTLEIVQHGVQDTESLMKKLHGQVGDINRHYDASKARVEQAERVIERVTAAEHEMRDISTQLGERLQHLQTYWDEQLGDSVESVKRIRGKLKEGLEGVDDSLSRLRDQEKMAQGFTRKLIEHHQQQIQSQQENSRLSGEVHHRLEDMLQESGHLLEQMQRYQKDADNIFQHFSEEMTGLESQASEQFTSLFQTTDQARAELSAGLEETRQHLSEMRLRDAQSDELTRRVMAQFDKLDHLRVERISKTLDLTDQISNDLQKGVENAREMLSTLQRAVTDVSSVLSAEDDGKVADSATVSTLVTQPKKDIPAPETDADSDLFDVLTQPYADVAPDDKDLRKLVSLRAYR
jgi:chromosome segregation ATPase